VSGKSTFPLDAIVPSVPGLLDEMQTELFQRAQRRLADDTADVETVADAVDAAATGFARIRYATLGESGEDELAANAITVRCLQTEGGELPASQDEELFAIVARSY
jgi:prolyl-tRNA synthetase